MTSIKGFASKLRFLLYIFQSQGLNLGCDIEFQMSSFDTDGNHKIIAFKYFFYFFSARLKKISKNFAKNFCYQNIFDKTHISGHCKAVVKNLAGDLSQFWAFSFNTPPSRFKV